MMTLRGLTLSLITHALVFGLLVLWAKQGAQKSLLKETINPITFEVLDKKSMTLFLENEASPTNKKKALFTAENTRRVLEQQQARFLGDTINRKFPGLEPQKKTPPAQRFIPKSMASGTLTVQQPDEKRKEIPLGISTIQTRLDQDIKFGDFTSLNTDQNLYFSFYTRIAQRLRFHWEHGVEDVISSLGFRNLNIKEDKIFTTEVEVQVNSEGQYVQTLIYRSSGNIALDNAVVNSFKRSTPFVNPPKEMVQDDGLIHLFYAFRVHYSPRFYAHP